MTTDLQRMHQDEWLSALRSAETQGFGLGAVDTQPHCALGHAKAIAGYEDWVNDACRWLGISHPMVYAIFKANDANEWRETALRHPGSMSVPRSLSEIADWFKVERDAHDGDLSEWGTS